jgi:hypothetical protein
MLTFRGDEIVTSKPLGFINDSGLATILFDSDCILCIWIPGGL